MIEQKEAHGGAALPVGVQRDIDEVFCYSADETYMQRAHAYIERYEVQRGWQRSVTAVQCVVEDIARRAFLAGLEGCGAKRACADCAGFVPYPHRIGGKSYDGICSDDNSPTNVDYDACSGYRNENEKE